ncbi:MAG: sulfotransferase [Sulfurimonas sp.]|nr:sulfotransferase [Sulfurimonas sp.]
MSQNFLKNPVFICGHRKTGTTMLISLFDNAEDAVVYPDDSSFFYMYYPRYEGDLYSKEEKLKRLDDILNVFLKDLINEFKIDKTQKQQFFEKHKKFYTAIKDEIILSDDLSIKYILKVVMKNIHKYFYLNKKPKVWFEKTTSTEIYALDLIKMFPNAKFIHLIRDPRDNWASLKSGWDEKYKKYNDEQKRLLQSLIERGKLGLEFAKNNREILGEKCYKVVKFEDLTADPEKTMKELADFAGIKYSENLLHPTRFGVSWGGNNFEGAKFKKPSSENANRWRERIAEEEAQIIEYHFEDIMNYFDYKLVFSKEQRVEAAKEHYKWFNFSTPYSAD